MLLRILQLLLVVLALAVGSLATERRMSTAQVELESPVDMSEVDTLTIYGEETHDLLDLIDLSLASGTIRFESLALTNSGVISSTLSINAGTELVLDGVRTLNSNISISAAGGKVKVRNSMLGAINSPIAITHPASEVEIDNSAICRAQTGIRITAGQLTLNNTLFLTNTQALNIQGGQVLGLQNLSFQGCEKGIRIENSTTPLTFTRCDFSGARDSLITNASVQTLQLFECYIDTLDTLKVFGPISKTALALNPWRPQERPSLSVLIDEDDVVDIPLSCLPSEFTMTGLPYLPSSFRFYVSIDPYDFSDATIIETSSQSINVSVGQSDAIFFRASVCIGKWVSN